MSKRKATETVSLIRWIREIQSQAKKQDIQIDFDDSSMNEWNVIFKPSYFDKISTFEVQSDADVWVPVDPQISTGLQNLVEGFPILGEGSTYYGIGQHMYETRIDTSGTLTQRNMETGTKRQIRSAKLSDNIIKWIGLHGKNEEPGIHLKVQFPDDFPHLPPFVYVKFPRFEQYSGHITIGGSICLEMLTISGWNSKIKPLVLLLMIRDNIIQGNAKIDFKKCVPYDETVARKTFKRVAEFHGWKV